MIYYRCSALSALRIYHTRMVTLKRKKEKEEKRFRVLSIFFTKINGLFFLFRKNKHEKDDAAATVTSRIHELQLFRNAYIYFYTTIYVAAFILCKVGVAMSQR